MVLKGCGNHGCRVKKPTGMATNGGCTCSNDILLRIQDKLPDNLMTRGGRLLVIGLVIEALKERANE